MKPVFFAPPALGGHLPVPMDAGSVRWGSRDFAAIERRPEGRPSREQPADVALVRENKFIKRMLDDRDRQFAALQDELSAMRRNWAWRTLGVFGLGLRRFSRPPGEPDTSRASVRQVSS
jgi:hypothetical protein